MTGPVVGSAEGYEVDGKERIPWVLGTQLHPEVGPLGRAPAGSRVLMIEAREFAARKPYHHQKLTLLFSSMRQFRDELRDRGYDVEYVQAPTFADGLARYFRQYPDSMLVAMRSPSHGSAERLQELAEVAGGSLDVVENELFVSTRQAFDDWANDADVDPFTHENVYRWLRRKTGVLMAGSDPVGGKWNFDEENREFPPEDWEPPATCDPDTDDLTRAVSEWVGETFDPWGDPGIGSGSDSGFVWPVTREGALARLEHFVEERLPAFGPYQDAMRRGDWAMAHSLLSPSINLGHFHPWEAITAIEDAAEDDPNLPLNSVEGVIRQLLGWREFMRHVYRHAMPELATANQLGATRALPEFYWTGETGMECLSESVGDVQTRGYSHHIQRLMVLANFATLWGVEPAELNEWFHATYVDAYHWVTTPNVIEMGQYAHGIFATKPYVSSANYVNRMSDYCESCRYDPDRDTGEDACPFNALYWDFLARNEDDLRSNHRMGLMYGHVDDKRDSGALAEIRERVERLRERERDGGL
ncbi:cryptochrome/photolyase family protein [Halobacteriales archaeon SW_7_65_23]|nr:MAG: cryptochrome/photolyase family protein [Halobacteriales archaeon SW_7_65_23]